MIKLRWNKEYIDFISITWSGTHNQSSRSISVSLPCNPYDKDFSNKNIKLGDIVQLFDDKEQLFLGTVTSREKSAEIGTFSFVALDFMHHLLRSNGSYKFKKTTPEKITKQVCSEAGIPVGDLPKTNCMIKKMFFDDQTLYDIIIRAYREVSATTKKKFMPIMDGKKVTVIEKGKKSGVTLTQGLDITEATYTETTDNMVNLVKIYNDSMKQLGEIKNQKTVEKYGVYQSVYVKEEDESAKEKALEMMQGITREASVGAIGNVKAISGKSIIIKDKATGLSGTFYITSDSHTFSDNVHTMVLDLSWSNEMEEGAETTNDEGKADVTNKSKCYYLDGSSVYHSSTSCSACKGKQTHTSTVALMKKIKITSGDNKGKRKFKPCSKCWQT